MPIQHSPAARQTRAQARAQAVLTPTPRDPLDGTPEGLSRTTFKGPGEHYAEEEVSDGTEGVPPPVGASQGTGGPTLAQSNQPGSHQSEPSLSAIVKQITQIMANIEADSSSEASRPPAFKTPSMKAAE
ncbi:hypothetical protein O181_034091 [Austropuccinia psidii MF-1]|uniref:Uncharacterized protein n=1 Tax=Austropuccinia psidii MF-1 TaxID=1389203 RepID=A0A9Q3D5P4_9BASI|nr:hypothetical protein [Austropuccinia psidii MF-1]